MDFGKNFLMWDTSVFFNLDTDVKYLQNNDKGKKISKMTFFGLISMEWVINALETGGKLFKFLFYCSEISTNIDTFSIGNHPDIVKAMQAIKIDNPPASKSNDAIDIIP
ncbi:hypothetical protein RhiirC2_858245 [Rhizophagus irregularis]|uniref:Uncharacterized protein n=1 Tax=Rhizophagus irregularis TaxID=588596 RepID=A0A2N1M6V2_9GLOM|nr:hypothetical protein RhiirC2_858245 [Rhizophagus irregularis]